MLAELIIRLIVCVYDDTVRVRYAFAPPNAFGGDEPED